MRKNKTVIGEINVEVKAGLSVDRKTAEICMDLLAIYYKNNDAKGVVLAFPDDDMCDVGKQLLMSEQAVEEAMHTAFCSVQLDKLQRPAEED